MKKIALLISLSLLISCSDLAENNILSENEIDIINNESVAQDKKITDSNLTSENNNLEIKTKLNETVDSYIGKGALAISTALYTPETGIVTVSGGSPTISKTKELTENAKFKIGSCSKTYVSTIMMQLVEEGKVRLSDLISKYVDQNIIDQIPNAEKANLKQILNHSSGIYDYLDEDFTNDYQSNPTKVWKNEDVLKFAYSEEDNSSFDNGKGFDYSNTNTILAGVIIEKVTNKSLAKNLRERIFDPLSLKDSYLDVFETIPEMVAHGYGVIDGKLTDINQVNQGYGLADGGIVSSASDVVKFLRALFKDGKLISKESIEQMTETINPEKNYGFYLEVENSDFGKKLGHSGSVVGFLSNMYYYPEEDIAIVNLISGDDNTIADLEAGLSKDINKITFD